MCNVLLNFMQLIESFTVINYFVTQLFLNIIQILSTKRVLMYKSKKWPIIINN